MLTNKTSIIILHGWRLLGNHYLPLIKQLTKRGFTVYSPDLPGFGKAKRPNHPLTVNDYADYVLGLIKQRKMKKTVIIGHSFGGRIGIVLAAEHQERVKALIVTGTPGILPVSRKKISFLLILAKIGNAVFSLPPLLTFQNTARKIFYKIIGAWDYYHTQGVMRETFKNVIAYDLKKHLAKIHVPTLIIWGGQDNIVPVSTGKKMAKLIPNSKWAIIEEAGHGLPYELPKKFAEVIISFLAKKEIA